MIGSSLSGPKISIDCLATDARLGWGSRADFRRAEDETGRQTDGLMDGRTKGRTDERMKER